MFNCHTFLAPIHNASLLSCLQTRQLSPDIEADAFGLCHKAALLGEKTKNGTFSELSSSRTRICPRVQYPLLCSIITNIGLLGEAAVKLYNIKVH